MRRLRLRVAWFAALGVWIPPPLAGQVLSLERLTVQANFDKKQVPAPAQILFTFVPGASDFYSADVALRYSILSTDFTELGPAFEYHRKTETAKEQFLIKAGLSLDHLFGDLAVKRAVPVLIGSLNYVDDRVEDKTGFQVTGTFTTLFRGRAGNPRYFGVPNITSQFGNCPLPDPDDPDPDDSGRCFFHFTYEPDIALEYQYSDVDGVAPASGSVVRGLLSVKAMIHPAARALRKRLAFAAGYTYRRVMIDSGSLEEGSYGIFRASVQWTLFGEAGAKPSAGINLTYLEGSDPASGIDDERYGQLAFALRF